jgi:hypothetical protein
MKSIAATVMILCLPLPTLAQSPAAIQVVADPIATIDRLARVLETTGASAFGDEIAKALGNPEAKALAQHLSFLEKKKPAFSAIAYDREYGGAIRHIVQYHYGLTDNSPFIYFRYVYKQTGDGWRMTTFSFEGESQMPFPPKYGIN